MKKRNYGLDLLRITLCLCVITLHAFNHFGNSSYLVDMLVPTILASANGLFYILSGYFNLEKEFNSGSDILNFYKNKMLYVLFPFLAFNFVWVIWDYLHVTGGFNFLGILLTYYKTIMNSSAEGHMWFMYPLFGMLLSTPFLSKMLHAMNEKELKILFRVAIIYNVINYFLCEDFGISFRVMSWLLDGWIIYYVLGYYYRHVISKESTVKWVILGSLGYLFTVFGINQKLPVFEHFVGGNDIQPMFTLFCLGLLVVWTKLVNIRNEKAGTVISFLGRNAYLIYLYHIRGIEYAVRKLNIIDANFVNGILVVLGSFAFSLIAAYVTNLCLKLVQKPLDKIWIIK